IIFHSYTYLISFLFFYLFFFFFFNDTAPTEIYTLSLHDALPILNEDDAVGLALLRVGGCAEKTDVQARRARDERKNAEPERELRSEEHTSELQSRGHLVCRLLLEKKKKKIKIEKIHGNKDM